MCPSEAWQKASASTLPSAGQPTVGDQRFIFEFGVGATGAGFCTLSFLFASKSHPARFGAGGEGGGCLGGAGCASARELATPHSANVTSPTLILLRAFLMVVPSSLVDALGSVPRTRGEMQAPEGRRPRV